jgi:hypothetical protein
LELRLNSFFKNRAQAGLPDFSRYNISKWEIYNKMAPKFTKWPQNIPNGGEMDLMAIKFANSFSARLSEIYPNFWF